jgi:hypothetical protein
MDRTVPMNMLGRTVAALLLVFSVPVGAQMTREAREYDALIDRLFAVPEDGVYILRFIRSSFEPEMQVVFSLPFADGQCSAKVWHLPKGTTPLLVRLLERFDTVPPPKLYEGLVATQATVQVPCDGELAKRLQEVSSFAVPIPRNYTIAVDGVAFQLEVRLGSTRVEFNAHTGGLDESYEDPLLDWMATVGRSFRAAVR